jgi:hypothetical protein
MVAFCQYATPQEYVLRILWNGEMARKREEKKKRKGGGIGWQVDVVGLLHGCRFFFVFGLLESSWSIEI